MKGMRVYTFRWGRFVNAGQDSWLRALARNGTHTMHVPRSTFEAAVVKGMVFLRVQVFVDTEADIRLIRRLHRDVKERGRSVDSVMSQYVKTVRYAIILLI